MEKIERYKVAQEINIKITKKLFDKKTDEK